MFVEAEWSSQNIDLVTAAVSPTDWGAFNRHSIVYMRQRLNSMFISV